MPLIFSFIFLIPFPSSQDLLNPYDTVIQECFCPISVNQNHDFWVEEKSVYFIHSPNAKAHSQRDTPVFSSFTCLFADGPGPSLPRAGTALQLWRTGLSLQWLLDAWRAGSQAWGLQGLQLTGQAALRHVGSAQTRGWACVPCAGRRFLTTGLAGKSNTPIFTGTARVKFQPTISQLECIAWAPLLSLPSPLKCVTYLWGPGGAEPNGHLTALAYFRSKVIRYSSVSQTRLRRTYNGVTSLLQG